MRIRAVGPPLLGIIAVVGACESFSSTDAPGTSPSVDGGADVLADRTDPLPDAGPAPNGNPPDPGALLDDRFESLPTCDGWVNVSGGTALPVDGGRSGRACRLCSSNVGAAGMQKTVALDGGGTYQLLGWARREAVDASPNVGGYSAFLDGDGAAAGNGSNISTLKDDDWHLVQAVAANVAPNAVKTVLSLEVSPADVCVLIDDVTFTVSR